MDPVRAGTGTGGKDGIYGDIIKLFAFYPEKDYT
jgi:hypothetical protein